MQHPGAVDLNCPDTDAQAMGNRLVRFALNQAIEDLSFAPGKLREAAHKITQLSRRERQVLDGLVQGEPHKTIAHRLGISVRTVEIHRTRMLHRLGTPHLAEAIRLAVLAELAGE